MDHDLPARPHGEHLCDEPVPDPAHESRPGRRLQGVTHDESPPGANDPDRVAHFEELFFEYEPAVRKALYKFGARGAEIEDAVQDAFRTVWVTLLNGHATKKWSAWIPCVAINAHRSNLRKEVRLRRRAAEHGSPNGVVRPSAPGTGSVEEILPRRARDDSATWRTPEDDVVARDELGGALARLSATDHAVLALRATDVPAARAAEFLGITVSAYHARLHRARRALRAQLHDGGSCDEQPAQEDTDTDGHGGHHDD